MQETLLESDPIALPIQETEVAGFAQRQTLPPYPANRTSRVELKVKPPMRELLDELNLLPLMLVQELPLVFIEEDEPQPESRETTSSRSSIAGNAGREWNL